MNSLDLPSGFQDQDRWAEEIIGVDTSIEDELCVPMVPVSRHGRTPSVSDIALEYDNVAHPTRKGFLAADTLLRGSRRWLFSFEIGGGPKLVVPAFHRARSRGELK